VQIILCCQQDLTICLMLKGFLLRRFCIRNDLFSPLQWGLEMSIPSNNHWLQYQRKHVNFSTECSLINFESINNVALTKVVLWVQVVSALARFFLPHNVNSWGLSAFTSTLNSCLLLIVIQGVLCFFFFYYKLYISIYNLINTLMFNKITNSKCTDNITVTCNMLTSQERRPSNLKKIGQKRKYTILSPRDI
jgi:hypothetical protein